MRRLAVEATDETGPANSFPVYGVCHEPTRQKPQWQEWNAIAAGVWELEAGQVEDIEAVSYTHLTLPTIYSV